MRTAGQKCVHPGIYSLMGKIRQPLPLIMGMHRKHRYTRDLLRPPDRLQNRLQIRLVDRADPGNVVLITNPAVLAQKTEPLSPPRNSRYPFLLSQRQKLLRRRRRFLPRR